MLYGPPPVMSQRKGRGAAVCIALGALGWLLSAKRVSEMGRLRTVSGDQTKALLQPYRQETVVNLRQLP